MNTRKPTEVNAIFTQDFISNPAKVLGIEPTTEKDIEAYIERHRFDVNKLPPEDSHIFFYNGIPIGSRGNILAITGKAKSRKTVVASGIATSAFKKEGGFLGFTADLQPEDEILHIDTEQGYYHYYGSVVRIFRDADLGKNIPNNFHSIHTRDATVDLRIEILEYMFAKIKPRVAILDGVTDFVKDLNNQEEATRLGEILLRLSYQYDALIIVIIHTTKTTGFMTGAVGTYFEKKAQTVIKVERDDDKEEKGSPDISHVSCQYARDKGFASFSIRYEEAIGRYEILPETDVIKKGKQGDKSPQGYDDSVHKVIITRAFGYRDLLDDVEIRSLVQKAFKQVTGDNMPNTLRGKYINYYNERAWIFQTPESAWMRAVAGATSNHTATASEQTGLFNSAPPAGTGSTDDLPF